MRVVGLGVDIVEVRRVGRLIERLGADQPGAWFTALEAQTAPTGPQRAAYFAGRIAAKEAVSKALGTGFVGDVAPTDIEIRRQPTGAPEVVVTGGTAAEAATRGITSWLVSISHTQSYAVANAIALADDPV